MGKKGKKTKKKTKKEEDSDFSEDDDMEEEELEEEVTTKKKKTTKSSSSKKKKGKKKKKYSSDEEDDESLEEKSDDESEAESKEDSDEEEEDKKENLYARKLKKQTKGIAKMIWEQVQNNKKITSLYQCYKDKFTVKPKLVLKRFKAKLEKLIGKNKSEYKEIEGVFKDFAFGGEDITFNSFFITMYQYLYKEAGSDLNMGDIELKVLKEKYIGKDIPADQTIQDRISKEKIKKVFLNGKVLDKKSFTKEIIKKVLPTLGDKKAKKDLEVIFNVFSCLCKNDDEIAMDDFLNFIGDFKSTGGDDDEDDDDEDESEEDEEEEDEEEEDSKKSKKKSVAKFTLVSKELKKLFEAYMEKTERPIETMRKEFQKIDKKGGNGTVTFKEFEKIIKKKMKKAKSDDITVVMDCFDLEQKQLVAYEDFIVYLESLGESAEVKELKLKLRSEITSSLNEAPDDDDALTYKKRRELLQETFALVDKNDQGFIKKKAFESSLKKLIDINKKELKLLSSALDEDGNGKITYAEFVAFVFPDRELDETIKLMRASLKAGVKNFGGENAVKSLFDNIDTDQNGKLSVDEIVAEFILCEFPIDSSVAYQIMMRYDKDGDGTINPKEFFDILDEVENDEDDEDDEEKEEEDENLDDSNDSAANTGALLTKGMKRILWQGGISLALKQKTSAKNAVLKGFKKKEAEGETVTIKKPVFLKDLKTMKAFKLKSHHYEKIADTFSHDASRENVDISEFAAFVSTPAHDFGRDGKEIKKIAEKLHAGIDKEFEKRKSKYKTTYVMMKEIFAAQGGDKKKGTIPENKLESVLKKISPSVKLKNDEIDALKRRFVIKGTIHYNDFIYFIDPQPDIEKLIKKLRVKIKIMNRHGKDIETIFEEADADKSGALAYGEFATLLKTTCGLPLTDAQCHALIKRLDVDNDEEVDMDEFLDLVIEDDEEEEEEKDAKDKKKGNTDAKNKKDAKKTAEIKPEDWEKVKKILVVWVNDDEENIDTFEEEAENVAGEKKTAIEDEEFIDCLLTAGCDKLSKAQQALVCNKFRTKGKDSMVDFVAFLDYCEEVANLVADEDDKKKKEVEKSKSATDKDKKKDEATTKSTSKKPEKKKDDDKKKVKETSGTKILKHSKDQKFMIGDMVWVSFEDDDYEQVKITSYDSKKKQYEGEFQDGSGDKDTFDEAELSAENPKEKKKAGKDVTAKKKDDKKSAKGKDKKDDKKKKKVTIKEEQDDEEDESSSEEEEDDDEDDEENLLPVDEWYKKIQEKAFDQAFKEIDTDGSGAIDASELGSALRAMGQSPTDEEVQSLLSEFDHSNTGQIDKNGFRKLMKRRLGHKRRKEQHAKSKATLDQVQVLFEEIDVDNSGSLDSKEFEILVKKRMRIQLTAKEFASLFEAIDLDNSGTVEFDEFSKLWEAVEEHQSGSRSKRRVMSALAERAVQKIAKGPIEDPRKYLRAYAGMPSNFRPSVLSKLDNDPLHSIGHMLSGAADELMSHQVLKAHHNGKRIKFEELRELDDLSSIKAYVKLNDATGVPIPDEENRKHIENRWIRVCLMRGNPNEDQESSTSRRKFVGNQHIALANLKEEDVWDFTKKGTGLSNKRMVIKSNASDAKDLYLIFELTCTVRKNGNSGAKSTFEMGVAWGAIKLEDANVHSKKTFRLTMKGGTIDEDTEIKPDEILQNRTFVKGLFHRKKTACQLELVFQPISSSSKGISVQDIRSIRLLPPTIICSLECVKLLHMYRYIMSHGYSNALSTNSGGRKKKKKGKKGRRDYDSDEDSDDDSDDDDRRRRRGGSSDFRKDASTPNFGIHLPELKIFPQILKEPTLLLQLLNFPEIKVMQKTMQKDPLKACKDFRKCILQLWPQVTVHGASYSHEHGGLENAERRRLRPTKTAKNMLGNVQRANLDMPFMSNLENDGGAGWNKPFHINEVTMQAPDTACAFSALENMILASVTGKAKKARKVKRGGDSPDRRKKKKKNRWDDDDDDF